MMQGIKRFAGRLVRAIIAIVLIAVWAWASLAIYYESPDPQWVKTMAAALFCLLLPVSFVILKIFKNGVILSIFFFLIFSTWWWTIEPTNEKDWAPDVAQISSGEIQGTKLIMKNVRHFS